MGQTSFDNKSGITFKTTTDEGKNISVAFINSPIDSKGDIYVQLAFVADMNPNSAFNIASYDLVAVAMNNDK